MKNRGQQSLAERREELFPLVLLLFRPRAATNVSTPPLQHEYLSLKFILIIHQSLSRAYPIETIKTTEPVT